MRNPLAGLMGALSRRLSRASAGSADTAWMPSPVDFTTRPACASTAVRESTLARSHPFCRMPAHNT